MRTSKQAIATALAHLNLQDIEHLFIHSSLLSLGIIEGEEIANTPNVFYGLLQQGMNPKGNIYVPTFNYCFPSSRAEDLRLQKSEMGVFAEFIRGLPEASRSGHPMFSIAGVGPKAASICQPERAEFHPFDKNSTYYRLYQNDAYLLLQGVDFRVATVIVLFEYLLNAQYRFDKPFHGRTVLQNGKAINADFYHYCFPLNGAYRENYARLVKYLESEGFVQKVKLGFSHLLLISFKKLFEAITYLYDKDLFVLLNCRPRALYCYENGQEVSYTV